MNVVDEEMNKKEIKKENSVCCCTMKQDKVWTLMVMDMKVSDVCNTLVDYNFFEYYSKGVS